MVVLKRGVVARELLVRGARIFCKSKTKDIRFEFIVESVDFEKWTWSGLCARAYGKDVSSESYSVRPGVVKERTIWHTGANELVIFTDNDHELYSFRILPPTRFSLNTLFLASLGR